MAKPEMLIEDYVHDWFGLSYSSFAVLPRSIMQSMPAEWQKRFVELMNGLEDAGYAYPMEGHTYNVMLRSNETGRLMCDPLGRYDRGRRYVEPRPGAAAYG